MFLLLKKEDIPARKYILVATAIVLCIFVLWARNNRMNQNTLNAFVLVDIGLTKTTANFVAKNETIYASFDAEMEMIPAKVEPFRNMAYRVKDWADQLHYDLQQLKLEIILSCDRDNTPSLTPAYWYIGANREKKPTGDIDSRFIRGKSNMSVPSNLIFNKGKGQELRKKIENYKDFLLSVTYNPTLQKFIMDALNTDNFQDLLGTPIAWESAHFESLPMIAVIAQLSKLQNDVRIAEADVIQFLHSEIGATDIRVNKMEAVVQAKSRYVTKGDDFEARILMVAYDSLQKPEILIEPFHRTQRGEYELVGEGKFLPYDARGRAMYKVTTTTSGNFTLQGIMRMNIPLWGVVNFPFSYEYTVGEEKIP
jgi:gliding motility-associated protein GldM